MKKLKRNLAPVVSYRGGVRELRGARFLA